MILFKIKCKSNLNKDESQIITDEFEKYANINNLKTNYDQFNFVAYENEQIVGILEGFTLYDEIHVNNLIVKAQHRKKGIGTKLLNFVSEYFENKKFECISLCTYEFQAPKFYEKCGFKLEFTRKNKENPKLTKYFYTKHLQGV